MTKLLFLLIVALIPLLLIAPSLVSATTVTPQQHKCIHDKISEVLTHSGGGFDAGMKMENEILAIVDNTTANLESCLQ